MFRDLLDFFLRLSSPRMFIGLDTKTIDRHIHELNEHRWFNTLYEDANFRKLFFTNVHVRRYLENKRRVRKLIINPLAREKFIIFLEKQRKR
ncbi:hypothetical protein ABE41_005760 [Fictibacillus arsenicus]|uniref:Uncharacterized protein n=1 Tax=Fictibacillus arsenicus TaxID=255247 RepID=A0A1B1Z1Z1_9BACL|nr:hypothetical protein [Fictibacillus arsenicus]ANX11506.1 hypothetical protein ABE41_005760 [Fictibacillus arsenicus]